MRFNHTKSAIHSPGHSHILFTSARDWESAHWTLVLHILVNLFPKCQHKTNAGSSLTMPRVRCKQLSEETMEPAVEKPGDTWGLHVESLTRNKSTCACPARSYWAMTSMRERKSKGCASVPKHFYIFLMDIKRSSKFLGFITMVGLLKFNIIEKIPFSVCLEIPCITFKTEKSFIAHLWIQRPVVGLECIHWAWSAATAPWGQGH